MRATAWKLRAPAVCIPPLQPQFSHMELDSIWTTNSVPGWEGGAPGNQDWDASTLHAVGQGNPLTKDQIEQLLNRMWQELHAMTGDAFHTIYLCLDSKPFKSYGHFPFFLQTATRRTCRRYSDQCETPLFISCSSIGLALLVCTIPGQALWPSPTSLRLSHNMIGS